jgi:carbon storage regulator
MVGAKAVLILSRKTGESIRIGPDVEIRVLAVHGKKVRLGISAPSDRSIWRAELIRDGEGAPAKHCEAELNAVC